MGEKSSKINDPKEEILESLRDEYEENLGNLIANSLNDLTRIIAGRIVDRFRMRKSEFRDRILEGARLVGLNDPDGSFGDLVDSVLEDVLSDIIRTVDEAVEGYVRWSSGSQLVTGVYGIVDDLVKRLADEMFKRMELESKRKKRTAEDFTKKSTMWRILRKLEEVGPRTTTQLAAEMGLSESAVRGHLKKLLERGHVKRTEKKPYIYSFVSAPWSGEAS